MTLLVGLAMAEICPLPDVGRPVLMGPRPAPPRSLAWAGPPPGSNVLGRVAATAGIGFGAASFLCGYLNLQFGFGATRGRVLKGCQEP
ncbi:hypothetical protein SRO_0062 [Streptomyces rochei]|nr:hypothetical protein SRO_0062 [Streptomyces rochei]